MRWKNAVVARHRMDPAAHLAASASSNRGRMSGVLKLGYGSHAGALGEEGQHETLLSERVTWDDGFSW